MTPMNINIPFSTRPISRRLLRSFFLSLLLLLVGPAPARSQSTHVFVDPSQTWIGYMNWSPVATDAAGYGGAGGSSWATADLDALFAGGVATLTPNTSISRDVSTTNTYWWSADGGGANEMDALFYVQNDTLAGDTVTFTGYCWANTLTAAYTSTVFIKDLSPGYNSATATNLLLVSGQPFSITLATTPGDHIQYGFETVGPNASLASVAGLGSAIVSSNPPPSLPFMTTPPANTTAILGSNAVLSGVVSGSSLTYSWWNNGVRLTNGPGVSGAATSTLVLSNVLDSTEGTYTLVASNVRGAVTNSAFLTVVNPAALAVDPNAPWIGYMNVYDLSMNYEFGGAWGVSDLTAGFADSSLALGPNTNVYNPTNSYWVNPDGSGADIMDASFYQQLDSLSGLTLTFSGYCLTNTLANGYTSTVFIKAFTSSYLATTPFDHIEWGFETIGPDANPSTVASLGQVLISVYPPALSATRAAGVSSLSFPTLTGHSYVIQYTDDLASGTWQTLKAINGTGTPAVVTDTTASTARFYRLSVQDVPIVF